jgi:hypothetical protein
LPILRHLVDEEQAQHLHAQGAQALLLVQMFLDGAADHLPMHGAGIDIAPGLADAQKHLAARHLQLKKLVCLLPLPPDLPMRMSAYSAAWFPAADRSRPAR